MAVKQAYALDVHEAFGFDPQSLDTQGECTDYEQSVSAATRLQGKVQHGPE